MQRSINQIKSFPKFVIKNLPRKPFALIKKRTASMSGFTLIELLVVVLIIGILAAVAVPQYQKAVEKTRTTNLYTLLRAIVKAEQVYHLANNKYTNNPDDLDITYPAGSTVNGNIVILPDHKQIVFLPDLLYSATDYVQLQLYYEKGNGSCWAIENPISQAVCASIGTKGSGVPSICSGLAGKSCVEYRLTY